MQGYVRLPGLPRSQPQCPCAPGGQQPCSRTSGGARAALPPTSPAAPSSSKSSSSSPFPRLQPHRAPSRAFLLGWWKAVCAEVISASFTQGKWGGKRPRGISVLSQSPLPGVSCPEFPLGPSCIPSSVWNPGPSRMVSLEQTTVLVEAQTPVGQGCPEVGSGQDQPRSLSAC